MGNTAKARYRRRRRAHGGDWRAAVLARYPNFAAAGYFPVRRKAGRKAGREWDEIHWQKVEAFAITWRKP